MDPIIIVNGEPFASLSEAEAHADWLDTMGVPLVVEEPPKACAAPDDAEGPDTGIFGDY